MIASLLRLRQFVGRYRVRLLAGVGLFGVARLLEAAVPVLLGISIDRISAGSADLKWPVIGIFAAVAGRFLVVSGARYAVRSTGLRVAFDLARCVGTPNVPLGRVGQPAKAGAAKLSQQASVLR